MLRKITVLLSALAMMMVMSVPALAFSENGNKSDDGPDFNRGGGQEHTRNAHPPKAGGEKHAGGDKHGGGAPCSSCE